MKNEDGQIKGMNARRITLADGRYLIFYTFDEEGATKHSEKNVEASEAAQRQPVAAPQAEEERGV
jgi:hypothetical protein